MELSEKIVALEAEKKHYLNIIDNLNAEKIALDQMCIETLKNNLNIRKDNILLNAHLTKERENNTSITKELEEIKNQLIDKEEIIEK